ncbi:MAG: MerR family transcriptional regulator [Acidimicrobiales bacterium]
MPELRVDELAAAAGVTVDVVRSYQSKGLLPPPRHAGRVALYGPGHLERLRTIRQLKERGHSLRAIGAMLAEQPAGGGRAAAPGRDGTSGDDERLTVNEVAERARVPPSLLRSLEASGLLRPLRAGDEAYYTAADVRAVRMVLTLVGGGVPLEDFMRVARTQIDAAATVAEGAVELFLRYVRQPLLEADLAPETEAARLVSALKAMLQAANGLVSYSVERMMLNLVEERIESLGTGEERQALLREVAGRPRPADAAVEAAR